MPLPEKQFQKIFSLPALVAREMLFSIHATNGKSAKTILKNLSLLAKVAQLLLPHSPCHSAQSARNFRLYILLIRTTLARLMLG